MSQSVAAAATLRAWNQSFLTSLPTNLRDQLIDDAQVFSVSKGQAIYEAFGLPRLALVHNGLARVMALSVDGRGATIRYAKEGQFVGLPSVVVGISPLGAEAVTDCEVSFLNPTMVRSLGRSNGTFAWLLAQELAENSYTSADFLGSNLFDTVQRRVARHLLDLATSTAEGLVVSSTQSEIANSVGSVREVVARALRHLRELGCIERAVAGTLITHPELLRSIAR